jgi:hypothetical protein
MLTEALTDIQKLINYLTNIEVRESVSIETLVPVTPTAGERANEVKKMYDETRMLLDAVSTREVSTKFRNKVRYGTEEAEERLANVLRAMSEGNLSEAKRAVDEAHTFASDIQKLLSNEPLKTATDIVETPEDEVLESVDAVVE